MNFWEGSMLFRGLDGFFLIDFHWLELWNRKIIHVTPPSERRKAFWGTGKQTGKYNNIISEKYREVERQIIQKRKTMVNILRNIFDQMEKPYIFQRSLLNSTILW